MTDTQTTNDTSDLSFQAIGMDGGAETITISRIDFEAPWRWLTAGWSDLVAMPHIGLVYGAVFTAIAASLFLGLDEIGWQSMILALGGGFMLIGPVLAVGLYEASRLRQQGKKARFFAVVSSGLQSPGQLSLLGFALLFTFMIWVHLAFLLFMLFFGARAFPPIEDFVPMLLFSISGVGLLVFGTFVGAVLASIVFAISAISAPMLVDRQVSAITAIFSSVSAVRQNPKPMMLWAVLIAGFVAAGIATLSLGLIVAFPLIGHASWHAYREIAGQPRI